MLLNSDGNEPYFIEMEGAADGAFVVSLALRQHEMLEVEVEQ